MAEFKRPRPGASRPGGSRPRPERGEWERSDSVSRSESKSASSEPLLELADQLEEQSRALLAHARQLRRLAGQTSDAGAAGEAGAARAAPRSFSRNVPARGGSDDKRESAPRQRSRSASRDGGGEDRPRRSGGGSGAPKWAKKPSRGKR